MFEAYGSLTILLVVCDTFSVVSVSVFVFGASEYCPLLGLWGVCGLGKCSRLKVSWLQRYGSSQGEGLSFQGVRLEEGDEEEEE